MKLLVQPGAGVTPLVKAIDGAKRSVEIMIFRFDRREVERALIKAAGRGVFVHALIANTNRGGEQNLRELEARLLAAGITVARTADDLVRYHGKFVIVDKRELHLLAFNFTFADIERSRSFGVITANKKLVQEAVKLFECDTKRQKYEAGNPAFVVSPISSRKVLADFIRGTRKELWIYDPKTSDPAMTRLIEERAKAGVDVRIIGRMTRKNPAIPVYRLASKRLHTRTILRDRKDLFIGSQSLRALELDARREVGIILRDKTAVKAIRDIFEEDWAAAEHLAASGDKPPAVKMAKKVAKVVTKDLPSVAPIIEEVVKEIAGVNGVDVNAEKLEEAVKQAVKHAVKVAVQDVVQEVVDSAPEPEAEEVRAVGGK